MTQRAPLLSSVHQRFLFITRSFCECINRDVWREFVGLGVITLSLLSYGLLQERIMTIGFGPHDELFEYSIFLVLCNRICTCTVAAIMCLFTDHTLKPAAPLYHYAAISLTNVISTSCQYEALKYVSFTMQTIAKSAKIFPVMVWGAVISGKTYKASAIASAMVITVGCTLFVLSGDVRSRVSAVEGSLAAVFGALLLLLYLVFDGLTSTNQDRLFVNYDVSIYQQVMYSTAMSGVISLVAAAFTHQLIPSIQFLMRNHEAFSWIIALSISSASFQLVITYCVKRYGAVVYATIMTTRQFFSILLSSMFFWMPLTLGQWVGVVLVFGALYYKAVHGRGGKEAPTAHHHPSSASPHMHDMHLPLLATGTAPMLEVVSGGQGEGLLNRAAAAALKTSPSASDMLRRSPRVVADSQWPTFAQPRAPHEL